MTRIHLRLDVHPYVVKTLDSAEEREAAFRLRHEVFHREHHGRELPDRRDTDDFDAHCDHLGVFHHGALVGTYRLNRAGFYAAERFDLEPLRALPGDKIELGRACVATAFRSGAAVHLLWRGIAEYVRLAGARFLFGCSSVRIVEPREVAALYRELQRAGHVSVRVAVRAERRFDLSKCADGAARVVLPPLFAMYLKLGARIVAEPAHDAFLRCADFLTLLDIDAMNARFGKRYRMRSVVQASDTPAAFPAGFHGVTENPSFRPRS